MWDEYHFKSEKKALKGLHGFKPWKQTNKLGNSQTENVLEKHKWLQLKEENSDIKKMFAEISFSTYQNIMQAFKAYFKSIIYEISSFQTLSFNLLNLFIFSFEIWQDIRPITWWYWVGWHG